MSTSSGKRIFIVDLGIVIMVPEEYLYSLIRNLIGNVYIKMLFITSIGKSGSIGNSATVVGWGYSCYENGTRTFCSTGSTTVPTKVQQKLKVIVFLCECFT